MKRFLFLFWVLLFKPVFLFSEDRFEYFFKTLSDESGLSGTNISSIIQDRMGYLWFGSTRGLDCYDGYRIQNFKNIPSGEAGLNNGVSCLEEDSCGRLWIGRYFDNSAVLDISTHRLLRFGYRGTQMLFSVSAWKSTSKNEIWAGTGNGEVFRVTCLSSGKPDSIVVCPEKVEVRLPDGKKLRGVASFLPWRDGLIIGHADGITMIPRRVGKGVVVGKFYKMPAVNCLFQDSKGFIWAGTASGAFRLGYHPESRQFFDARTPIPDLLRNRLFICSIVEDTRKNVYFGTDQNGLYVYNPSDGNPSLVNYNRGNSPFFSNQLNTLYIDQSNKLWAGTYDEGVAMADLSQKRFYNLKYYSYTSPFNEVVISTVYEDRRDRLWVATEGDGLYCYQRISGKSVHKGVKRFRNYSNSRINKIFEDAEGNIWFCSLSGLFYLPCGSAFTETGKLTEITDKRLLHAAVSSMDQDVYGNYWLTIEGELCKLKLDLNNNKVVSFVFYPKGNMKDELPRGNVYFVRCSDRNALWVGSQGGGMSRVTFNGLNDKVSVEKYAPYNRNGYYISNRNVWFVLSYRDSIYAATDDGLNLYVRNKRNRYVYRKTWRVADGLPSNEVGGILNDKKGNLWLDTGNGLSKLLPDRRTFVNFDYPYGLQSNALAGGKCAGLSDTIYFGTSKQLNYFVPDEIKLDSIRPRTTLTNLYVYNQKVLPGVPIGGQVILEKIVACTKSIYLSHKNNHLTLQFSAFNFAWSRSNKYLYRLKGFDDEWRSTFENENSVSYSNLPAGQYLFEVRAVNSDGVMDEQAAALMIAVGAPFWKTGWAYFLYFLVSFIGVVTVFRYYHNKMRLQNEVQLEKRKREQERELAETKANFYTMLMHELRTPLTLISAPLSEINAGKVEGTRMKELLAMMTHNVGKLLKLSGQMLDFGKVEQEMVPLNLSRKEVVAFLRDLCFSFEPLAMQKEISLSFSSRCESFVANVDTDVMDKIVSNLLFNALKYTSRNGSVTLDFEVLYREQGVFCCVRVSDTGIGVASDKLDKIFEKYHQEEKGQGYGVGLSVVKKLVLFHQGTIDVESTPNVGTVFTVCFPAFVRAYVVDHPNDREFTGGNAASAEFGDDSNTESLFSENTTDWIRNEDAYPVETEPLEKGKKDKMILIVEDNEELLQFLCGNLSDRFEVLSAPDGRAGFQKAMEYLPDLIVSDVMMPFMDGIELSSAIKSDMRTNHIPFIFLTAKGGVENQVKGLMTGAEDYLIKPFDIRVLRKKVFNLLRLLEVNRERQRKRFLFEPMVPVALNRPPLDEAFLKKAKAVVLQNATDPYFNTEKLSKQMGLSRMHLYRKLKQMGISPSGFVQSVRLQRSAQPEGGDDAVQAVGIAAYDEVRSLAEDVFIQEAAKVVHRNISNPQFEAVGLGNAMNLTDIQLRRKLKGTLQMTVSEFIRSIRMKRAAELLQTGKYRVAEVMFEVGFEDPSYFTKVFKQQFGMTPMDYARKKD